MALSGVKVARWINLLVAGGLALVAWALATVLSTQPALKQLWDLSPQARFSVGESTEDLVRQLREAGHRVEIHTVFYPHGTRQVTTAGQRQEVAILQRLQELTTDLLRQYDYLGGDAIDVTYHDLLTRPADVREVVREVEKAHYDCVIVKLGARSKVLSLVVDMAVLDEPRSTTPQGLPQGAEGVVQLKDYKGEEAVSTALRRLLDEGTPKLYFLSGYSRMQTAGIGASYSTMLTALEEEGFEIAFLDLELEQRIPEDAAALCLVNPTTELSEGAVELLWRYVRGGGRLFVNLHYYLEPADWNASLRGLGERFGFRVGPELVCVPIPDPSDPGKFVDGYEMCQNLVAVDLNVTHPVTAPLLRQRRYPRFKAGRPIHGLEGGAPEGVRLQTYFLRTAPNAWLEERQRRAAGPLGNAGSTVDFYGPADRAAYGPVSIGAIVDVDAEGGRTGHVVLITAEGFDNLSFQWNGDFALNLFNWMTERPALISVRGRRYVSRELELAPQQVDRIGWLLIGIVPGVLLLLGLAVFWRRSRT